MPDWLLSSWHWFSGAAVVAFDVLATAHVVLHKRDVQAAIGWAGLIWFAPGVGPVLYYLLGVNRVERKARRLKRRRPARHHGTGATPGDADAGPWPTPPPGTPDWSATCPVRRYAVVSLMHDSMESRQLWQTVGADVWIL